MAKAAMTEMEEAKNKTEEEGGRRRREVVRWRGGEGGGSLTFLTRLGFKQGSSELIQRRWKQV